MNIARTLLRPDGDYLLVLLPSGLCLRYHSSLFAVICMRRTFVPGEGSPPLSLPTPGGRAFSSKSVSDGSVRARWAMKRPARGQLGRASGNTGMKPRSLAVEKGKTTAAPRLDAASSRRFAFPDKLIAFSATGAALRLPGMAQYLCRLAGGLVSASDLPGAAMTPWFAP